MQSLGQASNAELLSSLAGLNHHLTPGGRKALEAERAQWVQVHNTLARVWNIRAVTA